MSLFIVILFGLGAVLLVSGIEDTPIRQTFSDVWNGDITGKQGGGQDHGRGQPTRPRGGTGTADQLGYHQAIVRAWVNSQGHE